MDYIGSCFSLINFGSYDDDDDDYDYYASSNMLLDALRWNMLNIIRVELFLNCYNLWQIFVNSPKGELSKPRGQFAIVSLIITLMAQFTVQFNFGWLLTIYAIYLTIGLGHWLYKRVYFYHRRFDLLGITQTLRTYDNPTGYTNNQPAGLPNHNTNTLKPNKHNNHHHNPDTGSLSSASSSSSSGAPSTTTPMNNTNESHNTNSLQRQRVNAYRNFQSVLTEPRYNHREYALSLAHLSDVSKLVADKDVFDEMHFQILATRRDVVNIILRTLLFSASTLLAYLR